MLGIEFYAENFDVNVSQKLTGARLRGEGIANNYVNDGGEVPVKLDIFWVPAGRVNAETESMEFVTPLPTTGEQVPAAAGEWTPPRADLKPLVGPAGTGV